MPQQGKALRGHELARDGLPTAPPSLVFSAILQHATRSDADTRFLTPASADNVINSDNAPDQGFALPLASTSQILTINFLLLDPPSGSINLCLRKNGVDTSSTGFFLGPVSGNAIQIMASAIKFNAGDTWSVRLTQQHAGVGAGSAFNITVAFYA